MADNDIELSVGVKFDEASFTNQFPSFVSKTSAEMQKHINDIVDNTSGTAAKQWGTLPYLTMHDASKGAANATKAFLPSLAQDLQNAGYSPDSPEYQGALVNAAYRSSMADPMQRYHRMLAGGLTQWADLTHPDTAVGQTIETDYQLMSQPWSRDFIRQAKGEELDADKLGKLKVRELRKMADDFGLKGLSHANKADIISTLVEKSKEPRLGFDFAGMREYAVEAGLGRWKNEDGEHTADNFELINDELEKIEDKSKKTKKNFLDWHDVLKGTLGTLTAIAAIGIKAFEVAYKSSEKNTIEAGGHVDSRRAFIGMSALDELKTKVASKAVGLGEDSIKNEIYNMSDFRERYKLMGEGDALPSALLNIFDNMVSSDDPYSAYTKSADEIYASLQGADDSTRRRWLMLMNKAGLGSMSSLVGQFLSNPEYTERYKTPSALFDLKDNPFYGVYNEAETMLPDIAKLNESLAASYKTMYTEWEKAFGEPFKTWWDDVMKDKVVPWFQRFVRYATRTEDEKKADEAADGIIFSMGMGGIKNRNKRIEDQSGYAWFNYKAPPPEKLGGGRLGQLLSSDYSDRQGKQAQRTWDDFNEIAKMKDSDFKDMPNALKAKKRIAVMVQKLKDTKLDTFLKNTNDEAMDAYLIKAIQRGANSTDPEWEKQFDDYIDKVLGIGTNGEILSEIVGVLSQIAENTGAAAQMGKNDKFWETLGWYLGQGKAEELRNQYFGEDSTVNR